MNSLYTSGVRQTNALHADLERLRQGDTSASLLGQISASLAAMHRTIDDYDSIARREMIKTKQEKAETRVQKFRKDYAEFRNQFEILKDDAAISTSDAQRKELMPVTSAASTEIARRRFQTSSPSTSTLPAELQQHSESPFRGAELRTREMRALDEHEFIRGTEGRLDEFLAQGREVLNGLREQRDVLKGTQRRLMGAANTLGLSRDAIGWIERRSTQDIYVFFGGAVFTFFCFYLIWRYLG